MEIMTNTEVLERTYTEIRDEAYKQKTRPILSENEVNNIFLDTIISFKEKLVSCTGTITKCSEKLERLSWLNGINEEDLKKISDIISQTFSLHRALVKSFVNMGTIRKKGIAKTEIKNFKLEIDTLKEITEDLDMTFFQLPLVSGFKETTAELHSL